MTGFASIDGAVQAIKDGANDYLIKPFRIGTIQTTVEKALQHRELLIENRRLQENSLNVLRTMVNVLEQRDSYTAGHSRRVTEVALTIAGRAGVPEEECKTLRLAGIIHDVGKIGIEDTILRKPARLSPEEYSVIRTHPERGVQIIEPLDFLRGTLPIVRHHHEYFDGKGYPGRARRRGDPARGAHRGDRGHLRRDHLVARLPHRPGDGRGARRDRALRAHPVRPRPGRVVRGYLPLRRPRRRPLPLRERPGGPPHPVTPPLAKEASPA